MSTANSYRNYLLAVLKNYEGIYDLEYIIKIYHKISLLDKMDPWENITRGEAANLENKAKKYADSIISKVMNYDK